MPQIQDHDQFHVTYRHDTKTYLFARICTGSHESAQRIAIMYSFMATCKAKCMNPYEWLEATLEVITETKLSQSHTLLLGAYNNLTSQLRY